MTPTYTPGPWFTAKRGADCNFIINVYAKRGAAIAQLIAAAPDLLAALRLMMATQIPFASIEDGGLGLTKSLDNLIPEAWNQRQTHAWEMARAAIARATTTETEERSTEAIEFLNRDGEYVRCAWSQREAYGYNARNLCGGYADADAWARATEEQTR